MFKYYSQAAAVATLKNRTVQLSAPGGFNDPFDAHLAEPLGLDPAEFVQQLKVDFVEFILGEMDYTRLRPGPRSEQVILMHQALARASPERRESYRQAALADDATKLYNIEQLSRDSEYMADFVSKTFSRYGIFCASQQPDVLLMWSHYADEHKGFVFEFEPSVEKDSAFLVAVPVKYTKVRPLMYRTPADMIYKSFMLSLEEATRQIINSIVYSKAQDWEYEQEVRLYIPDFVGLGQTRAYLQFHPEELTSVYVGCRARDDHKQEIISLARAVNPAVKIQNAEMDRREYQLSFVPEA